MNKIILMGRLTRDPEIRYSAGDSQTAVARFSLAVDRRFKRAGDEVTADFFNCCAFGKLAEFAEKYLRKGTKILLSGRLQNNNFTNQHGETVYSVQIIVDEMEFAESKKSVDAPVEDDDRRMNQYHGKPDSDGFMDIPDDVNDKDLPFN